MGDQQGLAGPRPPRVRQLRVAMLELARRAKKGSERVLGPQVFESAGARAVRARLGRMSTGHVLAILDALERRGVRAWVAGGWGVDALVGHQTRPHNDLDLLVKETDRGQALAALASLGYRLHTTIVVPGPLPPERLLVSNPAGRLVDLHAADLDAWQATLIASLTAMASDGARPAAFGTGSLGGRPVPCLSREAQLAAHVGYEQERRAVDDRDVDLLQSPESGS